MKITIDAKEIVVTDPNKNIVQIGEEHGITITAPCFRNKKQKGCCKACLIEIDGIQKYACGTKPTDGMKVIYNRKDLSEIRTDRLAKYAFNIKNQDTNSNTCCGSDSESPITITSSCGCSGSSCSD